ncbi:MAG: hypothetical protein PHC30_03895 [Lentisphaeria bacterium]|nr:hypothetical protein [Lentisphaeria bacterium]
MIYDKVVIGASFFGCGLAVALGRVKILEPSCVVGADFALTFNGGERWDTKVVHPLAKEYLAMLREHRAIDDQGRAAVAAFSPLLAQWCRKQGLDIELSCSVVDYRRKRLKLMGVDGPKEYCVSKIHSAVPRRQRRSYLTALVSGPADLGDGVYGDFTLKRSLYPGEYYLQFGYHAFFFWEQARDVFHQKWAQRPEALRDCRLLLIGTAVDWHNFPNPAVALDWGLRRKLEDLG